MKYIITEENLRNLEDILTDEQFDQLACANARHGAVLKINWPDSQLCTVCQNACFGSDDQTCYCDASMTGPNGMECPDYIEKDNDNVR
ncbi:hypothetical protein HNP86_001979 [Methanococcus maripaludis]|uniref:Uncharacterized protein n=1 Tax=Methanococcus maripaludis TaxID=39152 RepID=A0A7J9NVW1_METMI|nr:hypothetical protein [Methanococcus maripaludis]MBA2851820.1 hypothetical protein [Methanococcus maripaludis]